jgi:alkyl sulfatase BDS1-like metallo-beta-lactamase superfamily hydrolase
MERFFDAMATRLDGPKADGVSLAMNFVFTDLGESYRLWIENAVLHHRKLEKGAPARADVTVRLTKDFWLRLATGQAGIRDLVFSRDIDVDGSRTDLLKFFSLLDPPDPDFAIVRP